MIHNISNKTFFLMFLLVLLGMNEISTSNLNEEDDYSNNNNDEYQSDLIMRAAKPSKLIDTCTDLIESPKAWYSASETLRESCLIYLKLSKENKPRSVFPLMRERKFFALHMNKNNRLDQNEVSNARGFKYGK
jgi:hypothetical protein